MIKRYDRRMNESDDYRSAAERASLEFAQFELDCNSASFAADTLSKAIMKKLKRKKLNGTPDECYEQVVAMREWLEELTRDIRDAIADINYDRI